MHMNRQTVQSYLVTFDHLTDDQVTELQAIAHDDAANRYLLQLLSAVNAKPGYSAGLEKALKITQQTALIPYLKSYIAPVDEMNQSAEKTEIKKLKEDQKQSSADTGKWPLYQYQVSHFSVPIKRTIRVACVTRVQWNAF